MQTTILLDRSLIKELKKAKEYPRQTYNELLKKMLAVFLLFKDTEAVSANSHTLHRNRMIDIWNAKEDKIWDEL